jgi:predicted alpha/beta-fold hydrolase
MSEGMEALFQSDVPRDGAPETARELLATIKRALTEKPFVPHPLFTGGHAQTLAAYAWPRRFRLKEFSRDHSRLFEVEPSVRILTHYRWQERKRERPAMLLLHGLEGSTESIYILGTADKAFRAGFNVVRVNQRTCGKTEHLTPTLYHSGLTDDILFITRELIETEGFREIYLVGFSMSGNMCLRLVAERAKDLPPELRGVCAVSPSVDLVASAHAMAQPSNWIYQKSFLRSLHKRMRRKKKLFPELYDIQGLRRVRTMRDFDERFTSRHGGYKDATDYYARTSSFPLLNALRTPALIIHAEDDPFVPFQPLRHPSVAENPYIILLAPRTGGHVGFVAADNYAEDRFWAENRIVQFCRLLHEQLRP